MSNLSGLIAIFPPSFSNIILHRGFSGIAIGGIVVLDIFFFSSISGASMNPARSLAPALVSGMVNDLWLYWSATFAGTMIVAFALRKKMAEKIKEQENNMKV